jgi:L-threonylcarbamoyladenylate synthase
MPRVDVAEAVAILASGGLVALPTETVYGLAGDALDPCAIKRVFEKKGRPARHPLILHGVAPGRGGAAVQALAYGGPDPRARALADRFWPGPLTLVLLRQPEVPLELTGGYPTVALRAPAHPLFEAVLVGLGRPIAAPSANPFGGVSPTTAEHVLADFPDLPVVDGGPCTVGVESTILDLSGDVPAVLRPGGVGAEDIASVIGPVTIGGDTPAPGTLSAHYQPHAKVVVVSQARTRAVADAWRAIGTRVAVLPALAADAYAASLYRRLRELDAEGIQVIVAPEVAEVGIGVAVMDRLRRAGAGR